MGSYGSQNFKPVLLPQITFESFQTFPEFSSQRSPQTYCFGFLKFGFPIFNEFSNITIVPCGESKNLNYLEKKLPRAKQSEIWASRVSIQCTQGTFDTLVIKVILESFGAFRFSASLYLENGWS